MPRLIAVLFGLLLLVSCSAPPAGPAGAAEGGGAAGGEPPGRGAADPPAVEATPIVYDLVIAGGTVVDGTGAPGFRGDVAVSGDRIVAVGDVGPYRAERVIDATGLVVAPGFINPHSHTHDDLLNPFIERDAKASLMQGITTEIGGVDGRSPVDIGAFLSRLEAEGTGVNYGTYLGQGSVRAHVMGWAQGPAGEAQLAEMKRLVREGMEDGALGLSTGLEYQPGSFAGTAELVELVKETAPYGGIYATHMRSEGDALVEAIEEALEIGRQAGVPVNLSHLKIVHYRNWGKEDEVVRLIEEARAAGQRVFADVYPYRAPDYAVNRPLAEWASALPPEHLLIVDGAPGELQGLTVAEAAALLGLPESEAARSLLARHPNTRVVALVSSQRAMHRFYAADWSVVSTDGEAQPKLATAAEARAYAFHRRSYGTYPQLFEELVRKRGVLTLEQAVRKSTGQVADELGLKSRGYVKPGQYADLVLFDPATVADRTTWLSPQEYPEGIAYVLVNGHVVVDRGEWVGGRHGRIIRRGEE
ncbi:N-acyl-D-amino-acid deacylase family protein [Symbiobacterium thermophilum]|uniref:N-acyl-D-amino-acid deacylase n=1 Tax=Symbiobacterium thermophilum TaxID=2734 RepID=A0A953I9Q0_SYMTR|nr:D-aminoacylase [Symbiobacterium thermophilum]MBY6276629.1 N-acyl-D-amino-acid deacylase [Symbiobacterium thermophilum]